MEALCISKAVDLACRRTGTMSLKCNTLHMQSQLRSFGRYNNGRFYLLVDGPAAVAPWKMTRNQDLNVLHVDDANRWAAPLDAKVITVDTLIFDFVYFLHPVRLSFSLAVDLYVCYHILQRIGARIMKPTSLTVRLELPTVQ